MQYCLHLNSDVPFAQAEWCCNRDSRLESRQRRFLFGCLSMSIDARLKW